MDFEQTNFYLEKEKRMLDMLDDKKMISKEALQELLSAVEYDELTGLYTKQAFLYYAKKRIENHPDTDYVIIAVNMENFKLSNSQYGKQRCDDFLAYLGQRIGEVAVSTGIAGRFNGDRFVILTEKTPELTKEWLTGISDMVLNEAPLPHQVAKIGVYGLYTKIDRTIPLLLCCDRAFMAMEQIKGKYKENVAFYSKEMHEQLLMEQKIINCMEEALKQQQFHVYYQPKHDSFNGKIAGAEALVRWIHPELGFMAPNMFIPIFERNGFITKLDEYVVERVCSDVKRWSDAGINPIPISINVSRRDFLEDGWIEGCMNMIEGYQIDSALIHLEVTETLYTEKTNQMIQLINLVRRQGHLVEMDDFGSGYSSLGMLTDFPLDVIKLDISFVRKLENNAMVVDTIINLAHRMGFKTVAEGVETETQYLKLREMGCDYIQGYYFSKPLPVAEFEKYMFHDLADEFGEEGINSVISKSLWIDPIKELEIKNTLLECINILATDRSEREKVEHLLSVLARFYGGTQAYIFEVDNEHEMIKNTFLWCKEGVRSMIDGQQSTDIRAVQGWMEALKGNKAYYLPSIEQMKEEDPLGYMCLKSNGTESLVSVALKDEDHMVGLLTVDNPSIHTDTLFLLSSISSFIVHELNRDRTLTELKKLSFADNLTGLKNRSAYYHDVEIMEKDPEKMKKSLGIVYADVNGLKRANAEGGYEAGDRLIMSVVNVLKKQFEASSIYRIGSDEFIVLIQGIKENELTNFVQVLKESWSKEATASIGVAWLPETAKIEKWSALADHRMYEEKRQFYHSEEHDRRKRE